MAEETITINRDKLKQARKHGRYPTQSKLAKAAGISRTYLSEIETGKKQPSRPVIAALAMALKCDPSDLGASAVFRHGVWQT